MKLSATASSLSSSTTTLEQMIEQTRLSLMKHIDAISLSIRHVPEQLQRQDEHTHHQLAELSAKVDRELRAKAGDIAFIQNTLLNKVDFATLDDVMRVR